jgi:PRTRC genetic system protein F
VIAHQAQAAIALPWLSAAIPREVYVPSTANFAAPLALALLEAGVVTDDMIVPGPNATLVQVLAEPDEREMSMHALTVWWDGLKARFPMRTFRWEMHVQQLMEDFTGYQREQKSPVGWFCISRNQNTDIPRFTLARCAGILEKRLEGFGQTVLAVLYDATLRMPESLTPWVAADWAEQMYWQESENDEEMIRQAREEGRIAVAVGADPALDELVASDLMTRAKFYDGMPRWATQPRRVVSREAIVRAARGKYEKSVIAACDAIAELVGRPGFNLEPWDFGAHHTGHYPIDGCMVLLWHDNDRVGQVIDDWINGIYQTGEGSELLDAPPIPLTKKDVLNYIRRTEQMMELAQATERLLELIGDPL